MKANGRSSAQAALMLGALGVVFGDLGTSPLYTIQTAFNPHDPHPVAVSRTSVFGIVPLIFWSVTIIVTVTYVLLVMRADNDGEGGIMALITLIRRRGVRGGRRTKLALAGLGVFGASLFFGDSMITPAISVLSAIEGVKVAAPSLSSPVVPITAGIIVVLFLLQRLGSGAVGRMFGPVMAIWFVSIGACGLRGVVDDPSILKALSPSYAVGFLVGHFSVAFFSLAAVVLAVTGAEALYADLGHFGRAPITRAWLMIVFPACVLSYMGQGALILGNPGDASSNPFFLLVPHWGQLPMVFLAAAATVIASQAVITGAFSLTSQAAQIGYLPRLRVVFTSDERVGRIYVPWINWALMISVLALVITFRNSTALAYAFGMAVTGTITITTLLFFYIARHQWRKPLWLVVPGAAALLTLTSLFRRESDQIHPRRPATAPRRGDRLHRPHNLATRPRARDEAAPGKGGGASRLRRATPRHGAAACAVRRHRDLPQPREGDHSPRNARQRRAQPHPPSQRRDPLDRDPTRHDRITYVGARFGYKDDQNVPALIPLINQAGIEGPLDENDVSYFLSTIELQRGNAPGMSRWRKSLFLATTNLTADAAEHFRLPRDRTVIMGSRIEF